jgi:hypothetical protein
MVLIATLTHAPGAISNPGGTIIEVVQDDVFLLRHKMYFDEPGAAEHDCNIRQPTA